METRECIGLPRGKLVDNAQPVRATMMTSGLGPIQLPRLVVKCSKNSPGVADAYVEIRRQYPTSQIWNHVKTNSPPDLT